MPPRNVCAAVLSRLVQDPEGVNFPYSNQGLGVDLSRAATGDLVTLGGAMASGTGSAVGSNQVVVEFHFLLAPGG